MGFRLKSEYIRPGRALKDSKTPEMKFSDRVELVQKKTHQKILSFKKVTSILVSVGRSFTCLSVNPAFNDYISLLFP